MKRGRGTTGGAWLLTALLTVLAAAAAPADELHRALAQGNAEFAAGRYPEALEAFRRAEKLARDEQRAEVLHNLAATYFKLGQTAEARELWTRAAGLKDARFEAAARYNLGNCHYADALAAVSGEQPDANKALEHLERALGQYRDAVKLDPNLIDARANLELAHQLKLQIQEQSTSQPSSQNQPGQKDKNTTQPDSKQEQNPEQQGQDENQQGQQSTQPSDQQQSTQPSEQHDQQSATQPSEQQPQDQQSQQGEQSPESQPAEAQSQPAQAEPEPTSQPEDQQQQSGTSRPAVQLKLTPEQAERLLQMVRDAERARRMEMQRREAARHRPVEKDW